MATAWPVLPAVFSKVRLSASKLAPLDFDGFGEEGSACGFGVEGVGDDYVFGRAALADERDVGVVLCDDDAPVVSAGGDFDEDSAAWAGEGMVVHRHLDGRVLGGALDAGFDVGGDADVDVLRGERKDREG